MSIIKLARYFAWGLLLFPFGLVLLWLVITFVPGLAGFMAKVAWGLLGQVSIFSLASEVIQGCLSYHDFTLEQYFVSFPVLLFGAMGDSLIIGCCIFVLKACYTTFNRSWHARLTRPVWRLTLMGVVLGVGICLLKEALAGQWAGIFTLIAPLACCITGIVILLRTPLAARHRTYRSRRAGHILGLLLGIVGDVFGAICGVFIVTTLLQGSHFIKEGGSVLNCLLWIVLSALLLFLNNALMEMMKPKEI